MIRLRVVAFAVLFATGGLARGADLTQTSAICIEHIGESDKFIIGIAISDFDVGTKLCSADSVERVGLPDVWGNVIDSKLMAQLFEIVNSTSNDDDDHPGTFGTLAVVIINTDGKRVLVLNRGRAVMLLRALGKACTDRALRSRLANLRSQIAR